MSDIRTGTQGQTFGNNTWGKYSFLAANSTVAEQEAAVLGNPNNGYIYGIYNNGACTLYLYNSSKTLIRTYGPRTFTLQAGALPFHFNNTNGNNTILYKGVLFDPIGLTATPEVFDIFYGS